jgi:hypothetical protein
MKIALGLTHSFGFRSSLNSKICFIVNANIQQFALYTDCKGHSFHCQKHNMLSL